ncbi:MAG: DUF6766 family protein [Marmoricola sp.]
MSREQGRGGARAVLRDNGIGLGFGALFLLVLGLQSIAGWRDFDAQQAADGLQRLGWARYVVSASFAADVAENWQSEFLQFWAFLTATVYLVQRGSPESKKVDKTGKESDQDQKVGAHAEPDSPGPAHRSRGLRLSLYEHSLSYVMGTLFLLCWLAQSVAGWSAFDEEQLRNLQAPVSWGAYLLEPDFWDRTLQNWQSELLAVGSMAVFAVFLRQRGSSQSKRVGESHATTGDSD